MTYRWILPDGSMAGRNHQAAADWTAPTRRGKYTATVLVTDNRGSVSRLKSMTGPNTTQGTYRFDAMGNRVKRTWNYQSGSTWSGSLIAIYGPGGELLTEYKNETHSVYGETTTTYHIQMSGQTVAGGS